MDNTLNLNDRENFRGALLAAINTTHDIWPASSYITHRSYRGPFVDEIVFAIFGEEAPAVTEVTPGPIAGNAGAPLLAHDELVDA